MQTVSSSLKMFDKFVKAINRDLAKFNNMNLKIKVTAKLDTTKVLTDATQLRKKLQDSLKTIEVSARVVTSSATNPIAIQAPDATEFTRIIDITEGLAEKLEKTNELLDKPKKSVSGWMKAYEGVKKGAEVYFNVLNKGYQKLMASSMMSKMIGMAKTELSYLQGFIETIANSLSKLKVVQMIGTVFTKMSQLAKDGLNQISNGITKVVAKLMQIPKVAKTIEVVGKIFGGVFKGLSNIGEIKNIFPKMEDLRKMGSSFTKLAPVKSFPKEVFKHGLEQQKMEDIFTAKTGSAESGRGIVQRLSREAAASGVDPQQALKGALSFFNHTKSSDKLSKLNQLTARMSGLSPDEKGFDTAASAINDALSGDTAALAKQFQMKPEALKAMGFGEAGKPADLDSFMQAMDALLVKQGMSEEAFRNMLQSPAKQLDIVQENMRNAYANIGQSALAALQPVMVMFNEAFESGQLDFFFDILTNGFTLIGEIATSIGQLIFENLDIVKNILIALGIVALIVAADFLLGWIVAAFPLILIVGIMVAIMAVLNQLGVTTDVIVGFVFGLFMGLFAMLWNGVAFIWDFIVDFAEFFANVFRDPIYNVKMMFYSLVQVFGGFLVSMLKGAEKFAQSFWDIMSSSINWVIDRINSVSSWLGINLGEINTFQAPNVYSFSSKVQGILDNMEVPQSKNGQFDFDKAKMGQKDVSAMIDQGFNAGKNLFSDGGGDKNKGGFISQTLMSQNLAGGLEGGKTLEGSASNSTANNFTNTPKQIDKIGKVDEVGKINDKVDISSEDLKTMRELAEMKQIQNFVTFTPSLSFGDTHVRNPADMETIIARITDTLNQDIASTANMILT